MGEQGKHRQYIKVLETIDDTKFKKLPVSTEEKNVSLADKGSVVYENLWELIDLDSLKKTVDGIISKLKTREGKFDIRDFAWTKEAEYEFYNHPYHKAWYKEASTGGGMTWFGWVMNAEPIRVKKNDLGEWVPDMERLNIEKEE